MSAGSFVNPRPFLSTNSWRRLVNWHLFHRFNARFSEKTISQPLAAIFVIQSRIQLRRIVCARLR